MPTREASNKQTAFSTTSMYLINSPAEQLNLEQPNIEWLNLEQLNLERLNIKRLNIEQLNLEQQLIGKEPAPKNWTMIRPKLENNINFYIHIYTYNTNNETNSTILTYILTWKNT